MKFNESCSQCDEEVKVDLNDVGRDGTFTCPKCGSKELLCSMCDQKNCENNEGCFRCCSEDLETLKHFDRISDSIPHKDVPIGINGGKVFGDFYSPYDVEKTMKDFWKHLKESCKRWAARSRS